MWRESLWGVFGVHLCYLDRLRHLFVDGVVAWRQHVAALAQLVGAPPHGHEHHGAQEDVGLLAAPEDAWEGRGGQARGRREESAACEHS